MKQSSNLMEIKTRTSYLSIKHILQKIYFLIGLNDLPIDFFYSKLNKSASSIIGAVNLLQGFIKNLKREG